MDQVKGVMHEILDRICWRLDEIDFNGSVDENVELIRALVDELREEIEQLN